MAFRDIVQQDLVHIMDDEVEYFGKLIPVKMFENINDPTIANKGGVLTYFVSLASLFDGISRGQNIKVDKIDHTIVAFTENPNGGIVVTFNKASGR